MSHLTGKDMRMAGVAGVDAMELARIIAEVSAKARQDERARAVTIIQALAIQNRDDWICFCASSSARCARPEIHAPACNAARAYCEEKP